MAAAVPSRNAALLIHFVLVGVVVLQLCSLVPPTAAAGRVLAAGEQPCSGGANAAVAASVGGGGDTELLGGGGGDTEFLGGGCGSAVAADQQVGAGVDRRRLPFDDQPAVVDTHTDDDEDRMSVFELVRDIVTGSSGGYRGAQPAYGYGGYGLYVDKSAVVGQPGDENKYLKRDGVSAPKP
ncbi:hypothetical protein ACP4OV_022985 [Aristida adscensionis]